MKRLLLLPMLLLVVGCDPNRGYKSEELSGKVSDVRLTVASDTRVKSGDPVGGAVVGGLLFGTTGAVIGAATGSSDSQLTVKGTIAACGFSVEADSHKLNFRTTNEMLAKRCSLFRTGDLVKISKVTETWSSQSGSLSKEISYSWSFVEGYNSGSVKAEVEPVQVEVNK